jgi:sugar phosphate isomerase/epimerase
LGPDALVLCSGTLAPDTTFEDRLAAARDGGYQAVSMWGRDYDTARGGGRGDADIRALLADHGLAVAELDPVWSWTPGAAEVRIPAELDPLDVFHYDTPTLLRIAEAVGARSLNVVDIVGGTWGTEQGAEAFAHLCDQAAERGLLVHLEWLPWSRVPDLDAAWDIVRLADRPNGGLTIDTWHCARAGTTPAQLRALPGARVLALQVNDGPAQAEADLIDETMHRRLLPGSGAFDLIGYLGALRDIGASVPVGVEVFSDDLYARGATAAARVGAEAARAVLGTARWGQANQATEARTQR